MDKLSFLLGKANMLAVFAYSEKTARLRIELADVEKSVAKKWDTLFDVERRLGRAKRPGGGTTYSELPLSWNVKKGT
jgi:hypothetical protein